MVRDAYLTALANHKTGIDMTGSNIKPKSKTLMHATCKITDYIQQHVTLDYGNIVITRTAHQ